MAVVNSHKRRAVTNELDLRCFGIDNMVSTNKIYLWLSYQRYALLLFTVSATVAASVFAFELFSWLVLLPTVSFSLYLASVSLRIGGTIRKKLVLTRRTIQQIERGTFDPNDLAKYCTDPCWRVVVRHNLTLAGLPLKRRLELVRQWTEIANERQRQLIFASPDGRVIHVYQDDRLDTTVINRDVDPAKSPY